MESIEVIEYINSLNDKEKKALEIAKCHLKSSFDISKTIGFLEWKQLKEIKEKK